MIQPRAKYRVIRALQTFVINPPVTLAWKLGLAPPGDAQLETIGRRTGQPHRTPICDGLVGATFWLVAQHGHRTDYVRNIQANLASGSAPGLAAAGGPARRTSSTATTHASGWEC